MEKPRNLPELGFTGDLTRIFGSLQATAQQRATNVKSKPLHQILLTTAIFSVLAAVHAQTGQSQLSGDEQRSFEQMIEVGEAENALQQIETRIDEIALAAGRDADELVIPLLLKGKALHRLDFYDAALQTYDVARSIRRRHHGLHDLQQAEILYAEAETYYEQENYTAANDRHEYAFSLYRQNYGKDSPAILPALFRLADWYTDTHNFFTARGLYERALIDWDDESDIDPQERARALSSLANTYRFEAFPPSAFTSKSEKFTPRPYGSINHPEHYYAELNDFAKGEEALLELVKLQMDLADDASEPLAAAKLQLADWYLLFEQYEKANVVYKDIWDSLEGTPQFSFVHEHMTTPHTIHLPLPSDPKPPEETTKVVIELSGRLEFELTVTERGATKNIERISSHPGQMLAKETQKSIRESIYRPAFADGVAIVTDKVRFVHNFPYYRVDRSSRSLPTPSNTSYRSSK